MDNNGILRPKADSISITNDSSALCRYGGGIKDLYIADKCNTNNKSMSKLYNFGPKPSKEDKASSESEEES